MVAAADKWLCIDPGSTNSGIVQMAGDSVAWADNLSNQDVLSVIMRKQHDLLVMESVAYLSKNAGRSMIDTVFFSGCFCWESHRAGIPYARMPRQEVKKILLGKGKWKDADVNRRVNEIYAGPGKSLRDVVGTKESQGPLYGVTSHARQALAAGVALRIERGVCCLPGVNAGTLMEYLGDGKDV